jgi:hypothetical protein
MEKIIRMLCAVVVLASAVSLCHAGDSLDAKLAKLEAKSKVGQSTQESSVATESAEIITAEPPKSTGKSLAERIDELETRQKSMRQANSTRDARIVSLEEKLQALPEKLSCKADDVLVARLEGLEHKVQLLETRARQPHVKTDVDPALNNKGDEAQPLGQASSVKSDALPAEPVIKMTKLGTTPPFELPEDDIAFEVTADYFGKYVWRGQNLSDDPVLQPGVSLSIGGLTAGWWGSIDTTKINGNSGEFVEHDWSLDYSGDVPFVDGVGYSVGVINYYFPSADDTTEVYWGFGFDLPMSPSVTVYHDVDDVQGTYISTGVGHSVENIGELGADTPIGMDFGASLGWGSASYNKAYWGSSINSAKLNDLVLSVSFPFEISGWSLSPSLNYVSLVNGNVRETDTYSSSSDYFFGGISAAKVF